MTSTGLNCIYTGEIPSRSPGDIEGEQPLVFRWLKTAIPKEEPLPFPVLPGFPGCRKRYLARIEDRGITAILTANKRISYAGVGNDNLLWKPRSRIHMRKYQCFDGVLHQSLLHRVSNA